MEFFATCPAGFEQLLADELRSLRLHQVRPLRGQVSFEGELADGYTACLWSRLASRVIAVLARGHARNADELYETVSSVAWEDQLLPGRSFAIDAHGTNQQLRSSQFVALRAKDAVADRMMARTGARPTVNTDSPDLRISVRISRERATIGVDLAGEPLFRRGYDSARTPLPPLRPDYAAALLACGGWHRICRQDVPVLIVPFSGMGSLAVEGACQATDRAPGLDRLRWGFEGWTMHDPDLWESHRNDALKRAEAGAKKQVRLFLSDPHKGFEAVARQALRAAGVAVEPIFSTGEHAETADNALVACDLSWIGARDIAQKADALTRIGQATEGLAAGSTACVLTLDGLPDRVLGAPESQLDVRVGRDDGTMRSYALDARPAQTTVTAAGEEMPVLLEASEQFATRLAKVYKQRRKWARREDVSCYRIYDADLPDYAVSIDLFESCDKPGRWLQVYEYAPPKGIDADKALARLLDVVAIAPRLLDVRPEDTFVRVRTKARGGSQYANEGQAAKPTRGRKGRPGRPQLPPGAHLIDEGGLIFEVNFSTRLDCGIFLDHRDTRAMLREMAKDTRGSKRFLNLFAYTGTGTCYAADGGAKYTTTVDLSAPSLEWARRNMARNGFTGREHEFVQVDVIRWVSEQRHTKNRWDLVFCDVPTFSNSSRMRSASFDVQRDHAELLIGVSRLLTRDGVCVFSCNLRTFKLDYEALAKAGVEAEDITEQTIPEDFSRNKRIHCCFLVRRTPRSS